MTDQESKEAKERLLQDVMAFLDRLPTTRLDELQNFVVDQLLTRYLMLGGVIP